MIDFCLVGAGFIGPVHAANLALHPGARLRWVIDLNADAAKTLAGCSDFLGRVLNLPAMAKNAARDGWEQMSAAQHAA